jgi:hypothetical protein
MTVALLPPFFLDAVVAIGVGEDPSRRQWIGTGYIYGDFLKTEKVEEGERKHYQLWLITNKHVVVSKRSLYLKFNSAQELSSTDYKATLVSRNGRPLWVGHPKADVAAIFINAPVLEKEQRRFNYFRSDEHMMSRDEMSSLGVTEGDGVFVLGFPMGLVAPERQYAICRGGYVARIRDYLEDKAETFLTDCMVFPGNSGGPVVLCPSALAIQGTKPVGKAALIGMVESYVPYRDVAVSQQTKLPRVVFEENSGLASVVPLDAVRETVAIAAGRLKTRIESAKYRVRRRESGPAPNPPPPPNGTEPA